VGDGILDEGRLAASAVDRRIERFQDLGAGAEEHVIERLGDHLRVEPAVVDHPLLLVRERGRVGVRAEEPGRQLRLAHPVADGDEEGCPCLPRGLGDILGGSLYAPGARSAGHAKT
jgi:hypothetical protein